MEEKIYRSIDICRALEQATGKKSLPPTVSTKPSLEVARYLKDFDTITRESEQYSLQMD